MFHFVGHVSSHHMFVQLKTIETHLVVLTLFGSSGFFACWPCCIGIFTYTGMVDCLWWNVSRWYNIQHMIPSKMVFGWMIWKPNIWLFMVMYRPHVACSSSHAMFGDDGVSHARQRWSHAGPRLSYGSATGHEGGCRRQVLWYVPLGLNK